MLPLRPSTRREIPMPGWLVRPRRALLAAWLVSLLAPGVAPAADSPATRAVIARYLQALGGAAGPEERSTHVKGAVSAFGLKGTFEQWTVRPDRMAAVTTIGPFTLKEGSDASGAWRVDQNGKLARRDGKDLENARASAWFANEMWLVPGSGGPIALSGRRSAPTGR